MAKNRNEKLKANYRILRESGFSVEDAKRLRGASQEKILKAITEKVAPEKSKKHAKARRESKIPMKDISESDKQYLSRYTYKVSYKRKDGTTDWLTVTSDKKLSKKKIKEEAREYIIEGETEDIEKYTESKILLGSIKVEYGIINLR